LDEMGDVETTGPTVSMKASLLILDDDEISGRDENKVEEQGKELELAEEEEVVVSAEDNEDNEDKHEKSLESDEQKEATEKTVELDGEQITLFKRKCIEIYKHKENESLSLEVLRQKFQEDPVLSQTDMILSYINHLVEDDFLAIDKDGQSVYLI